MSTDIKSILQIDSSRLTADIAVDLIEDNTKDFDIAVDISLKTKPPLNWRAARVVALAAEKNPNLFIPYVNDIALRFPGFNNDGLKRSYARLLAQFYTFIDTSLIPALIDICFKYMLENEKPAVKYNCMILLYELSRIFPELKGELLAVIDYNIDKKVFKRNGEISRIMKSLEIRLR
jgi:hypothetical protein